MQGGSSTFKSRCLRAVLEGVPQQLRMQLTSMTLRDAPGPGAAGSAGGAGAGGVGGSTNGPRGPGSGLARGPSGHGPLLLAPGTSPPSALPLSAYMDRLVLEAEKSLREGGEGQQGGLGDNTDPGDPEGPFTAPLTSPTSPPMRASSLGGAAHGGTAGSHSARRRGSIDCGGRYSAAGAGATSTGMPISRSRSGRAAAAAHGASALSSSLQGHANGGASSAPAWPTASAGAAAGSGSGGSTSAGGGAGSSGGAAYGATTCCHDPTALAAAGKLVDEGVLVGLVKAYPGLRSLRLAGAGALTPHGLTEGLRAAGPRLEQVGVCVCVWPGSSTMIWLLQGAWRGGEGRSGQAPEGAKVGWDGMQGTQGITTCRPPCRWSF